jgi:hypothetical protein
MFGSSMVPSTCEWLARICSMSVEPERGRPRMKIGALLGEKALVEERADARAAALEVPDIERRIESLERVALRVVGEGLRVLTALLVRSAEGKM